MKQAQDFHDVCEQVEHLLSSLSDDDFARKTAFKEWSINQILCHLHVWDRAALLSLRDPEEFRDFMGKVAALRSKNFRQFEYEQAGSLSGIALFEAWRLFYPQLVEAFATADPKMRVAWVGPGMSARSSITARLMEVWSHAQAIYDEMGIERSPSEALSNIVVLGLNTFGWTFQNRGLDVPETTPQLVLTMASGEVQKFGETSSEERIEGSAQEFCQVVTQCRNIADTSLKVTGPVATQWMAIAQCFAGPPQDPPPPGARTRTNRL